MPKSDVGKPTMPTSPETPGTPGGPLFTALQIDSLSYEQSDRKTMPPCMCFPINAPTWTAPQTCFTGVSIRPDVSLTRKVLVAITGYYLTFLYFLNKCQVARTLIIHQGLHAGGNFFSA